jgi:hypothetical protein
MIENTTKQGGDFIGATRTNLAFRGSISYIASNNPASQVSNNSPSNDNSQQTQQQQD